MTHTKDEWVNSVMEQAQVFASAWSLVGSRFDSGNEMENAEEQKKALRAMLDTPPAAQEPVEQLGDGIFWCDTCRSVQETKDHSDPNDRDVWCKGEAAWLQGPFYTAPPTAPVQPVQEPVVCAVCNEVHGILDADESKIIRDAKDGYPDGRTPRTLTLQERVTALCVYAADWKRWCLEKENAITTIASEPEGAVSKGKYNRLRDDYNDLVNRSEQDAKDAKQWRKHVEYCQFQGVDLDYQLASPPTAPVQPLARVCHDLEGHIGWNPQLTELPPEGTELFTAAQPAPTGKSPCARHCEATAFQITIRGLRGEIERMKSAQPAPVQEPVAIVVAAEYEDGSTAGHRLEWRGRNEANDFPEGTEFYTAPQPVPVKTYHDGKPWPVAPKPWVGLTETEIDTWNIVGHETLREFIRAIEAKLKEKNHDQ
jgi:hypothetical protein